MTAILNVGPASLCQPFRRFTGNRKTPPGEPDGVLEKRRLIRLR
jgi:hypothetical protein